MHTTWIDFPSKALSVLGIATLAAVLAACSEDPAQLPPVPVVNSVSKTTVLPGDTVTIGGSDFAPAFRDNDVFFNNPIHASVPLTGSATSLRVVVPDDAATGPIRVAVPDQPVAGVGPEVTVNRDVGKVWVFAGTGDDYVLRLPFPTPNAEYLLVPHSANASAPFNQLHSYQISSGEAMAAPPAVASAGSGVPPMTGQELFDRNRRRSLEEILQTVDRSALAGRGLSVARAPQAPAQFRRFNVLNTAQGSLNKASNYDQVDAQLRYNGQFCLIYNDVDTLATGNFTQSDYIDMGQFFDSQGFPSDTLHFGRESDIDNNDKVIVLISGIINGLASTISEWDGTFFIGGFFSEIDMFRAGTVQVPEGTSNEAEIFYMLASDPAGVYLNPITFPRQNTREENKQTLVHEFEHLISYSYRLFNFGTRSTQKTWLEEGMAHMAEDLVGRNSSNVGRANKYLLDPGNVSLEDEGAPINQRGGIYLFLRYLGDRFGEEIYKQILQSGCAGRPCIEAIAGENFYDTVADFMATLYMSGRGITSDGTYNFTSIDLDDFQSLKVGGAQVGGQQLTGTVFRTAGDFFLITNPGGTEGEIMFTQSSNAGLRTVVVRTR
jgi:hypothetical protein